MFTSKFVNISVLAFFLLTVNTLLCAEDNGVEQSFLNKVKKVQNEERQAVQNLTKKQEPVMPQVEQNGDYPRGVLPEPAGNGQLPPAPLDYDASISSSTLSLIRTGKENIVYVGTEPSSEAAASVPAAKTETAAKAENKQQEQNVNEDKPAAATSVQEPQFKKQEQPRRKAPASNIKWIDSSTRNFTIKTEPHTTGSGIMTPNLGMKFETVYQILSKNISWMLAGKAQVYVYQNRQSFLRNEPVASSWSGAFFSPDENRIVMYDDPKNTDKMISQFSHELTHLFVENFYNPPGKQFTAEPPVWLNEGLAVNIEDISADIKGGVWANDLITMNILSEAEKKKLLARIKNKNKLSAQERKELASKVVSSRTVSFVNFADFVKNNSYDIAEKNGNVENWYFQAYAMVRFLFRQGRTMYPDKKMQFEQLTKILKTFEDKKDAKGNIVRDANGKPVKKRISTEAALRKAYGFKDMKDFENRFWKWLHSMQTQERQKITNS